MKKKYVAIVAVLLVIFMHQPSYSKDLTDNIEPELLGNISDSNADMESDIWEYMQDINSISQPLERLSFAENPQRIQNNTAVSKSYPKMTKEMNVSSKKAFLKQYMRKYGYSKNTIENVFTYINWSKVTDDFAPSFYTVIEKGYIDKYISASRCGFTCIDEKRMSDIYNLVVLMISKGYPNDCIMSVVHMSAWWEPINNTLLSI